MVFEVRHKDDAWELGVLHAAGFKVDVVLKDQLLKAYETGRHDSKVVAGNRIEKFAALWGV